MSEKSRAADPFGDSAEEQSQRDIFIATFSMLSKLASADGTVSKDEIQIIDRFMKNVLALDAERRAFAIQVFNDARRSDKDFQEFARDYYELLNGKPKMLEWMIDIFLQVSCSDKEYDESEKALIESAYKIFGISDVRYQELRSKYFKKPAGSSSAQSQSQSQAQGQGKAEGQASAPKSDTKSAYAVLKLPESATVEEIQAQSKKLSADYNPTRIVELGLPEEFVTLAEEKFREIMSAYKQLKTDRGF